MSIDVAVGCGQVEPAVVVGVEDDDAESEQEPAGPGQSDGDRPVGEEPAAQVLEEARRLAVEVGDEQVGPAVAVEVAHGRPHAGLVGARGVAGDARRGRDLLEPQAAQVAQEVIGRRVVGDEQVDPPVVVEVRRDDPEPPAVAVDDPRLGRHVHEAAAVVAEQVVGPGRGTGGACSSCTR